MLNATTKGIKGHYLGLKTIRGLSYEIHTNSYLIVGAWSLAVRKRCQPVVDQGQDSGWCHAIWNPILAGNHVQTAKV